MREVISINIGQGGVQLSNAAWELYCIEHGIESNGNLKENLKDGDSSAFKTFFQEVPLGQYVPRAVSIDLEPTVIDEIKTGAYRNLWHPDQLISGFEDAANNYARGHFTIGKKLIDITLDSIRKASDMCDMLQGFIIMGSLGGGTGSGFTASLLQKLAIEYTRRTKFQIVIVPSNNLSTAVVDPYNASLSIHSSTDHTEICSMFDNESVYKLCFKTLDISQPTYNNLNRVLAQVLSSLTVSLRYESFLNSDIDQLSTNLVPYPRIHFPVTTYAPLLSRRRAEHESLSTTELTRAVFDNGSQMVCCDMSVGQYMSCCLQYRGLVTPKEVNSAVFEIKRKNDIKFVSWCPTGFKLGINSQPSVSVPSSEMAQSNRSLTMMSNSTAIGQIWESICRKFDVLFSKRSFIHWYVGEGMEEGEFNEARDEIDSLVKDYIEIAMGDDEPVPEDVEHSPQKEPLEEPLGDGAEFAPAAVVSDEFEGQSPVVKENDMYKEEVEEEDEEDEDEEETEDN